MNIETNKSTEQWIAEGRQLLAERRYHDAHHAFETPWRYHTTPLRLLCQALVQVAAAGYHMKRGRRRVVCTLIHRAVPKLQVYRPDAGGVAVDRLIDDLLHLDRQIVAGTDVPAVDLLWPEFHAPTASAL